MPQAYKGPIRPQSKGGNQFGKPAVSGSGGGPSNGQDKQALLAALLEKQNKLKEQQAKKK